MKLKNKIGLITGATTGIGFETAKKALQEGAQAVVITGQNEERLQSAADALSTYGRAIPLRWRADKPTDSKELATGLKAQFESIDFVFANAGVCWPTPLGDAEADAIQQQFMINFTAPMLLIQELAPLFKNGGAVALTTSCINRLGIPGYAAYSATKAALRSLARTLSAELMENKIRVNALSPGPFETPIHNKSGMEGDALDDAKSQVASMVPMGRFGEPEEIVDAALFLLSDSSSYMVGEEIRVDGGWSTL